MNMNNFYIFHVGQTAPASVEGGGSDRAEPIMQKSGENGADGGVEDHEDVDTTTTTNTTNQPAEGHAGPGGIFDSLGGFFPIILIVAIFYLIMIRPAQRKEKERKKEISEMLAGSKILFGNGIIGTIKEVRSSTFMVEIASGVTIEIAKGAVQRIIKDGEIPTTENA